MKKLYYGGDIITMESEAEEVQRTGACHLPNNIVSQKVPRSAGRMNRFITQVLLNDMIWLVSFTKKH